MESRAKRNCVRLTIFVKPLKNETKLIVEPDGTLTMHVAAPPVKGKANREIIKWLAKKLGTQSSNVQLIAGFQSNLKTIEINGLTETEITTALRVDGRTRHA